jgi:hypothetical protein
VDLGDVKHQAAVGQLAAVRPPEEDVLSSADLALWLHSAQGVDVDPRGNVLRWRDLVRETECEMRVRE